MGIFGDWWAFLCSVSDSQSRDTYSTNYSSCKSRIVSVVTKRLLTRDHLPKDYPKRVYVYFFSDDGAGKYFGAHPERLIRAKDRRGLASTVPGALLSTLSFSSIRKALRPKSQILTVR